MKITSLEMTCSACPTQWEGRLDDGRWIYIRYRYGYLRYGVGKTFGEAIDNDSFGLECGDEYDGSMSTETMLSLTKLELDPLVLAKIKHEEEEHQKSVSEYWRKLKEEWEAAGKPDGDMFTWSLHGKGIKIEGVDNIGEVSK